MKIFVYVLQMILLTKITKTFKSVLGLNSKDRKSTRDKANISNPKVNKGCTPLTANRTSGSVCKFYLDPQYHIFHWGSTILGDSTLCMPLSQKHKKHPKGTTSTTSSLMSAKHSDQAWNRVTNAALRWRHNQRNGVSNHQLLDCLFNRLFRHRSNKTSMLRVTGLCEGNSPVTGERPVKRKMLPFDDIIMARKILDPDGFLFHFRHVVKIHQNSFIFFFQ